MDDRDVFDLLKIEFENTTGAEDKYWYPQEVGDGPKPIGRPCDGFDVWARGRGGEPERIGWFQHEADADFISAVHGCFPDLIHRLKQALDEADLKDLQRDQIALEHAELAAEHNYALARIRSLEARVDELLAPPDRWYPDQKFD